MDLLNRILDPNAPPVIVAELSGNHAQSIETAKRIIRLAAQSGVDAIKLQTYTADSLTLPSNSEDFMVRGGLWDGKSLYELYQKAATPYSWHKPLYELATKLGVSLFSTPFDEAAVDFLEETIAPKLYKVSSFEVTHLPLLERIGQTRKPTIMSVGMANQSEISEAITALKDNGSPEVILLKCISAYPSKAEDFHLRSMPKLAQTYHCTVGLSDHCLDNNVALAAVALGARLIEKHITDDRKAGGIDAAFSLEPHEFQQLVSASKQVHASLGSPKIQGSPQDASQLKFRRSIYVSEDIKAGEKLTPNNIKVIRPSHGLPPKRWKDTLGKTASIDLHPGKPLSESDFQ